MAKGRNNENIRKSIINKVKCWVIENVIVESGDTIVCAVSGGVDSIVMLDILHELSNELKFNVCAAHFNHSLRGEESDRDEHFVVEQCKAMNVKCFVGRGDVMKRADDCHESIEEAARVLRYEYLDNVVRSIRTGGKEVIFGENGESIYVGEEDRYSGQVKIATAHHANDNVETVIMNLLRGCTSQGISGIPVRRGNIIRPMLALTREEIRKYQEDTGLRNVEDSTNYEDDCLRNRMRHHVIPLLEKENKKLFNNCTNMCTTVREDNEYLNRIAAFKYRLFENYEYDVWFLRSLMESDKPICRRVIRMWLEKNGVECCQTSINSIMEMVIHPDTACKRSIAGNKNIDIVNNKLVMTDNRRGKKEVSNTNKKREAENKLLMMAKPTCEYTVRSTKSIGDEVNHRLVVNKESVDGTLVFREPTSSDKIKLKCGTKKVFKCLREKRVPKEKWDRCYVLESGNKIIGVIGIGVDIDYRVHPGDTALEFTSPVREE